MILRGMGEGGATSTGPAWVPTYGPAPSKSDPASAGPAAPTSPMKLIVATALVAGGIVGLATTVNWRKVFR